MENVLADRDVCNLDRNLFCTHTQKAYIYIYIYIHTHTHTVYAASQNKLRGRAKSAH